MCDGSGPKRPLPLAADTPDGPLGEASFHTHPATATFHEATAIQVRHNEVRLSTNNIFNNFVSEASQLKSN